VAATNKWYRVAQNHIGEQFKRATKRPASMGEALQSKRPIRKWVKQPTGKKTIGSAVKIAGENLKACWGLQ
jgi:hypothetical protein